jgi:PAS domain S-box-containing protein
VTTTTSEKVRVMRWCVMRWWRSGLAAALLLVAAGVTEATDPRPGLLRGQGGWYVLAVVVLAGAPALLIVALLGERRRRRRAQAELDERLRFETVVADLAAAFVGLPAREIDARIEEALRRIVAELGVDRAGLGELVPGGAQLRVTHAHTRSGVPVAPRAFASQDWPWVLRRLERGEAVRIAQLADLPTEAGTDRRSFEALGTQSIVLLPLVVGGVVVGGFACSVQRVRPWPEPLVQRLRLLADILGVVLMRRRADRALLESESRFRQMADAAPVMMWAADADGRCTDVNHAWLQFTGRALAEAIGDGRLDDVHADDRQACRAGYEAAVAARRPFTLEYRLLRADGAQRWVLDNGAPSVGPAGDFHGYVGAAVDVTEVKAAQHEVRWDREDLAHALRVATLGELATSLAHEINQPLAAIATNAQAARRLLVATPAADEVPAALQDIAADAQRAAQVIRRLRVLFRKEHGEREPVDITAVVKEAAALLGKELERRRVTLELVLPVDGPRVLGDVVQLQQVVVNVVLNAAEAVTGGEGPRQVRVEVHAREAGVVTIAVRDCGPAVTAMDLEQMFERFVTTKVDGLGLGLSISRSIIRAHGGRIWATRNSDRGLTVHIELPCLEGGPGAGLTEPKVL